MKTYNVKQILEFSIIIMENFLKAKIRHKCSIVEFLR